MKIAFLVSLFALACVGSAFTDAQKTASTDSSWIGVYSSPSEIGGYSGTALSIEKSFSGGLEHRMTFYSDVVIKGSIEQSELEGDVLIDGDKIYIATASGFYSHRKPVLSGRVERYTRVRIKGRTVLLRDDALEAYRRHDRLYDYGILIKVADRTDSSVDLKNVRHESIKVLYRNPKNEWNDPFVHGANKR
jgi:hypothetical protein